MPTKKEKYSDSNEEDKVLFAFDFLDIKRRLSSQLRETYPTEYSNSTKFDENNDPAGAINKLIFNQFKLRFESLNDYNAYLADYQESSGSFLANFTILVFGAFTNYGSIRETLDYFIEDLSKLFNFLLSNETPRYRVSTQVKEKSNKNNMPLARNRIAKDDDALQKLSIKTNVSISLSVLTAFILLLLFAQNFFSSSENDNDGKHEAQSLDRTDILKIISDEFRNQRIDEHIKNKVDTVYIIKRSK
jgi:hypothetical protein